MNGIGRDLGRLRSAARAANELLPLGLAFVAEAAWLMALMGVLQAAARAEPLLGLPALALLVTAGAVVGRLAAPRLGDGWPVLAAGLMVGAALGGVLVSPDARSLILAHGLAGLEGAVNAHPGGLLAGLAFLRGSAYAVPGLSAERLERLLAWGSVVIVIAAILGELTGNPWRSRLAMETLAAGLVFAAAGIVSLALRRQALEGADRGADWHRNPRWVALLVLVVIGLTLLAAVSAGLVRPALEVIIGVALVPVLLLGLIFGWTRRGLAQVAGFAVVAGLIALAFHLSPAVDVPDGGPAGPGPPVTEPTAELDPAVLSLLTLLVVLGVIVVAYLLARWWARRKGPDDDDPTEVRYIDPPPATARRPRRRSWARRLGWRRSPQDAVAAYRMLLEELDQRDVVRRAPSETPREHAARLRQLEIGGLPLELLAADYGLVAYGGEALSRHEQRRAIARWRSLRRTLRAPPLPDEPE
jgi:MFS family permease